MSATAEETKAISETIATQDHVISPFTVISQSDKGIDYQKLSTQLNMTPITDDLKAKFPSVHRWIRRGIYFAEQGGLQELLQQQTPFYVSLSKGPQAQGLHLGHAVTYEMGRYLQETYKVPVVIQIADDERYVYTNDGDLDKITKNVKNTIKDLLAFGFDPERTFVFVNTEFIDVLYRNICHIEKFTTQKTIREALNFTESDSVGAFALSAVRAAAMFSSSFPQILGQEARAVVPTAPDQYAFNKLALEVSETLKYPTPVFFYGQFVPSLQGLKTKMSSVADPGVVSSILLADSPADVKKKINKYAYSGGGVTLEDHKKNGGNTDIDVPFQYLRFFLEDDAQLEDIRARYSRGEMMTGEIKQAAVDCLSKIVSEYQERRKKVTDEQVTKFMQVRLLPTK